MRFLRLSRLPVLFDILTLCFPDRLRIACFRPTLLFPRNFETETGYQAVQ